MKRIIPYLSILLIICSVSSCKSTKLTGSQFVERIKGLSLEEREPIIYHEIANGNTPKSHRNPVRIAETLIDAAGVSHQVEFDVFPDVLSVGTDKDFFRTPMKPETAQKIADLYGATLPTSKLSDIIHKHAEVKMAPHPMTPGASMITVPVFAKHDSIIEQERRKHGKPLSALIAGHKKDVVISNLLVPRPHAVIIYGWHYPDGKRIQPIYAGHSSIHVDYSHGIRLVKNEVLLDGVKAKITDILRDPVLYKLFSDEDGAMIVTRYKLE